MDVLPEAEASFFTQILSQLRPEEAVDLLRRPIFFFAPLADGVFHLIDHLVEEDGFEFLGHLNWSLRCGPSCWLQR